MRIATRRDSEPLARSESGQLVPGDPERLSAPRSSSSRTSERRPSTIACTGQRSSVNLTEMPSIVTRYTLYSEPSSGGGAASSVRCSVEGASKRAPRVRQIDNPTSPSSTDVFSCGRCPPFHSAAVCNTRYRMGPPSGLSLRAMGRGMQTNSVRISSADNLTFA